MYLYCRGYCNDNNMFLLLRVWQKKFIRLVFFGELLSSIIILFSSPEGGLVNPDENRFPRH